MTAVGFLKGCDIRVFCGTKSTLSSYLTLQYKLTVLVRPLLHVTVRGFFVSLERTFISNKAFEKNR